MVWQMIMSDEKNHMTEMLSYKIVMRKKKSHETKTDVWKGQIWSRIYFKKYKIYCIYLCPLTTHIQPGTLGAKKSNTRWEYSHFHKAI